MTNFFQSPRRPGAGAKSGAGAELQFVFAGLAIVAATYGLARYAYGLFLPAIQDELGLSAATSGVIAALSYGGYLLATLAGSAFSGSLGPRLPVVLGGAAAAGGMALISVAENPWTLAAGVLIAGASPGLAYPPLSDATLRLVRREKQSRAYAVVNSGTSAGVVLAGPLALWAGADWRAAWGMFALLAALAAVWNARLLPSGPYGGCASALPRLRPRWFRRDGAGALFGSAGAFGAVTSVYWTFAPDFLLEESPLSEFSVRLFWIVIGVAGFGGALAGDLVRRFGLRAVFRAASLAVPAATALLLAADGTGTALLSGALFGAAFILTTGLFGIWSMNVFPDRPSAGFGAAFFLISAGQMLGPPLGGYCADHFGLTVTFAASLAAGIVAAWLGPKRDLRDISE